MIHWLGLFIFTAKGVGQGTKIPQDMRCGQEKKKNTSRVLPGYPVAKTPCS